MIRVTYEIDPPEAAESLALIASVGRADGPEFVRGRVVGVQANRAVLEFPETNWGSDVTLFVSSLLAGEWADSAAFRRCRLIALEWPSGLLPGPAFHVADRVLVGAIVKPSLGLSPQEFAAVAAQLAVGGANLIKDDELLGDPEWCPLAERVQAVASTIPEEVRYAANVTGPIESLLERAARVVDLGAGALMVNAFAQGFDSVRALREADFGVPIFAHRVGAALWTRNRNLGVAPSVVAEITRLSGADYVQVGSFSGTVQDTPEEVRAQIHACHRDLAGVARSTAVLGGGVGPDNAAGQIAAAGVGSGVMILLGSAAYEGGSPADAVRATVDSLPESSRPNTALDTA